MWLYARFSLSYRDIEDLLSERGLDVSYETVRCWFLKFGALIARNLRRTRPTPSDYWHLGEMANVIQSACYKGILSGRFYAGQLINRSSLISEVRFWSTQHGRLHRRGRLVRYNPRVTDQAALTRGDVQEVQGRRFYQFIYRLAQIHRDAGHGGGDSAAPCRTVQTMDVPAEEPCDLWMAADQRR